MVQNRDASTGDDDDEDDEDGDNDTQPQTYAQTVHTSPRGNRICEE